MDFYADQLRQQGYGLLPPHQEHSDLASPSVTLLDSLGLASLVFESEKFKNAAQLCRFFFQTSKFKAKKKKFVVA